MDNIPEELKEASFLKVVRCFARDMRDFDSAVYGGPKPNPSLSIMPVGQSNKKPRFAQDLPVGGEVPRNMGWQGNDRRPAPGGPQRGPQQGDGRQADARQGGARGGFGGGGWGLPSPGNVFQRSPTEKMKPGDLNL